MTAALVNRPNIPYGARQFKEYIEKSTYRAFVITLSLFAVAGLLFAALSMTNDLLLMPPLRLTPPIELKPYTVAPPASTPAIAQPKSTTSPASAAPVLNAPSVANFKPVPVVTPVEMVTFEPTAPAGNPSVVNSTSHGTNPGGSDPATNNPGGTQSGANTIPDKWDFNPVEKEPVVNLAQLSKNLIYPDMAKRSGLEGKVVLRVLIGRDGKAMDVDVIDSRSEILSKAAIDAVLKTQFTPAEQNGEFVNCWISIPVDFKLRQ